MPVNLIKLLNLIVGVSLLTFYSFDGARAFSGNGESYSSKSFQLLYIDAVQMVAASQGDVLDEQGQIGVGAKNFIGFMGKRALEFLGDDTITQEEKKALFRKLLEDSFDMNTIGRFSLGRYWNVSTQQQRDEYLSLFEAMVIKIYSRRFEDYKGQSFETRGFRIDSPKDTIVHSFVIPASGPEIQVDWRVRYKGGRYLVIDVIVEGVSMSVTQRSDFSSVIQRGGGNVDVLITHLKQQ